MPLPNARTREIAHLLAVPPDLCDDLSGPGRLALIAILAGGLTDEVRRARAVHWSSHPQRLANLRRALNAEVSALRSLALPQQKL